MQSAADATPEKTASAVPAKVALIKLEKHAYEAWKSKDAKFWRTFLSDNFVGVRLAGWIKRLRPRNIPARIAGSRATLCPTSK